MQIKKEPMIMIAIAAVVIGIGIFLAMRDNTQNSNQSKIADSSVLMKSNSHMTGNKSAKVNIVEFGDYECPACGAAYPVTKQILNEYQNNPDFNFVFRNFPLPQHSNAPMAAEAAEAAGAQGKFWQMHDKLYETQNDWVNLSDPSSLFVSYASALRLNLNQFQSDLKQNKYAPVIQSDQNDGLSLGINSTPTFFINGKEEVGVPNYNDLKSQIDALINK